MNPKIFCLFMFVSLFYQSFVYALQNDDLGGHLQAQVDGKTYVFPTLKTDIKVDLQSDLATVSVIQTFANPLHIPVNASYLFPLNKDAAVFEMIMEVADERIQAKIKRIEEAKADFEQAKSEGKSAALLTQYRPNMYTQDIANLMPGLPIKVTLRYVQTVAKVDGEYELVVPLVVGPRFQPAHAGQPPKIVDESAASIDAESKPISANSQTQYGQWELEQLPAYPAVNGLQIPGQVDSDRVSIAIELNSATPIATSKSTTHALHTESLSLYQQKIGLKNKRIVDNRDFVLRYSLEGETNQAGLLSYQDQRGGFFSLMIEPPATPSSNDITGREMVFVLDCSGSMSGLPMQASKAFMREALSKLRPTDTFRIIRFSDSANEFSSKPLAATAENIRRGLTYTQLLYGGGGTRMTSGIRQAFGPPVPSDAIRLVFFLTDGYIGNEAEILQLIHNRIGDARLFTFGVGTSVNRFLLSEMGNAGRGFSRFMDPTENVEKVAKELTARLQTPVLTDIEIDWGGFKPTELSPKRIPDLFAGQSIRIQGRFSNSGEFEVKVKGRINGRTATLPLKVNTTNANDSGQSIALVWARSMIKQTMRQFNLPMGMRKPEIENDALKQKVIHLGLKFDLVTRWTSFIAASEKIYNSQREPSPTLPVPLPQVKGVSALAYGKPTANNFSGSGFSGHGAPEPATVLGLLIIAAFLLWNWTRRRAYRVDNLR